MKILVVNCGSSSLKYQLINSESGDVLAKGYYERIGSDLAFLTHKVGGEKYKIEQPTKNHEEAIKVVIDQLTNSEYGVISDLSEIDAIGHRGVHGGEKFKSAVIINDEVVEQMRECIDLAPLHNPAVIVGIEACKAIMPNIPMVAVFDTAFHQTMEKEQYIYPIPYKYYEQYRVRKYGFHGTSHKYVANRVAEIMNKPIEELKIVNCHLGQGASLCAIKNGKSVDTTMGLTPLAGVIMGSRSGDIDPSILTYLMKKENLSPDEMSQILNKESGLLGISGVSADCRDIEAEAANGNERAKLALDYMDIQVAEYIAKFAVVLGGIDVITFTAGVGENGPQHREKICKYLEFLGVKVDKEANNVKGEERKISLPDSKVEVYIVPTNEELMIARETEEIVKK